MNIEELLKGGKFYSLNLNESNIEDAIRYLGEYEECDESKPFNDYYWGNFRLSFDEESGKLIKIEITLEEDICYHLTQGYKIDLKKDTDLEDIILYLNYQKINYSISNPPDISLDYLLIVLDNNWTFTYYLPWKQLVNIYILSTDW